MMALSVLFLLAFGYFYYRFRKQGLTDAKLPPGPKPWPIVGNFLDLPPIGTPEYQHWLKHKDIYGPISSVNVMGQIMVILHDKEAIHQLMEKSSLKTSSRPRFEFATAMGGFGRFVSFQNYNTVFRKHRKFIHQQLGTKKLIAQYNSVLETGAAHLLLRTLEHPQDLVQHFKDGAGAVILKITYGYSTDQNGSDPLISLIENMMKNLSAAFVPLSWSVDIIPALKHLPEWFPGASFHKRAKVWESINKAVTDVPYTFVRQQMANKVANHSYVSRHIHQIIGDEQKLSIEAEETIKSTAAILYAGGSDTTVTSLMSFILAMLKFPHVQRKAQAEIDALTGSSRLPRLADRENLPYMESILKEVLRWFPVAPMGAAHVVDQDVEVKGYLIPKDAILLPALKWLLHDPQVYKKPELFDPDRYMPPRNEPDPRISVFGFGRRVCPGRHLADISLFITISQLLATFQIEKALDGDGKPIDPQIRSTPGLIDHPVEFFYCISPRSPKHAALIRESQLEYPWEETNAGALLDLPNIE